MYVYTCVCVYTDVHVGKFYSNVDPTWYAIFHLAMKLVLGLCPFSRAQVIVKKKIRLSVLLLRRIVAFIDVILVHCARSALMQIE